MSRSGDKFKRAGFVNGGVIHLVDLRRADTGRQQFSCGVVLSAGSRQRVTSG